MEEIICPETGIRFVPRRYNQIFSTKKAQIEYNNRKAREERALLNPTNVILKNNRKLLSKIIGAKSEVTKSLEFLKGAGFNFKHFTHSILIDNKPVQAIYEFVIFKTNDMQFTIKKLTL